MIFMSGVMYLAISLPDTLARLLLMESILQNACYGLYVRNITDPAKNEWNDHFHDSTHGGVSKAKALIAAKGIF